MENDTKSFRGLLMEEALNNPFFRTLNTDTKEEFLDWGAANAAQYQNAKGDADTTAMARDWISGRINA